MSILNIRKYSDPILRTKCKPVQHVGNEEREILEDMSQTLEKAEGVGLAAPQVGIDKQLIVVKFEEKLIKLANPKIAQRDGWDIQEEGCLSIPGTYVSVKRAKRLKVVGLNEDGDEVRLAADGLLARVIQHEVDHLSGVLIIDHTNFLKRLLLMSRLRQFKGGDQND